MRTFLIVSLALLAVSIQAQDRIEIQLVPGFNYVSCNVVPPENMFDEGEDRGPHVPFMFDEFIENGNFYASNDLNQIYDFRWRFCNIPYWDLTKGLIVSVEQDEDVIWEGERIPANADILLDSRLANIAAYLPTFELNANADDFYVLSPIIDQVRWAIDDQGRFMMPEFNFSNMNPWRQGEGYIIVVEEDIMLNYPEERDEEPVIFEDGNHWELPVITRYVMPVLLNSIIGPEDFEPAGGDQVGAFGEDGEFVGCGTVHDGVCGLIIMGSDQEGGLDIGEEFTLIYWDDDREEEYAVNVEDVLVGEDGMAYRQWRPVVVEVSVGLREQIIRLNQGWNIISLNIEPLEEMWEVEGGPDVRRMMAQVLEAGNLELMKDEDGRFYLPDWDANNIPFWNLTEGYFVKVDEDFECRWSGNPIPPDNQIPVAERWNLIPFYPDYGLDASAPDFYALSPIIDVVNLAKNGDGEFMTPAFNFSNMPPWEPGQGYQINVNSDVVLQYPDEQEEENSVLTPIEYHWKEIAPTDNNMSLLITSISGIDPQPGSQIAAFSADGKMVGFGDFHDGTCGIAIWGAETGKFGLKSGDIFELRLWDANQEAESDLPISTIRTGSGLVYEVDGLSVIDVAITVNPPDNYFLSGAYPNPFNNRTTVKYGLPETGLVDMTIFDLSGRKMMELVNDEQSAGNHELDVNCTELTSGIYILSLKANRMNFTQKLVLVK